MRSFNLLALLPLVLANPLNVRTTACNNSPDLCDKTYGEITHLGAHDSPFVRDSTTDESIAGDQYYDTTTQLDAGVRLVTAQVHKSDSAWHLCHSSCDLLDAGLLQTWLGKIKTWLDDNPNEVVTILLVNSDSATAAELGAIYEAANITSYAYEPTSQTTAPSSWPTLQEMINNGTRLVNFVASLDTSSSYPYLLSEWDFVWENNYDVTDASNFTCTPNRPSTYDNDLTSALASNFLPLMNHFLYSTISVLDIEYPNASYVATTNAPSGGTGNLGSTATKCKEAYNGRQPTFILVDFFNRGPAIDTVDSLNNVTNAVGRTSVSTTASTSSSDGSTVNGVLTSLVNLAESARSGSTPTMGNWIWVGGSWGSILGGGISL
ncbi:hypothetical protein N7466_007070 [Penicillium verhagenii]|uniref:uncharacterized protein n=1 Tax=Penicillium verhagenii TaxID=1562060 RepID=UPI002545033B|nr:uncharacterized protein N7466_007070 [Penicillium verhagenii]KAJ5928114.1 hypothetical protein N7466_007070 [Penicillium verhagenii]